MEQYLISVVIAVISGLISYLTATRQNKSEIEKLKIQTQNDIDKLKLEHQQRLELLEKEATLSANNLRDSATTKLAENFLYKLLDGSMSMESLNKLKEVSNQFQNSR